jgi:hypothetical protein
MGQTGAYHQIHVPTGSIQSCRPAVSLPPGRISQKKTDNGGSRADDRFEEESDATFVCALSAVVIAGATAGKRILSFMMTSSRQKLANETAATRDTIRGMRKQPRSLKVLKAARTN